MVLERISRLAIWFTAVPTALAVLVPPATALVTFPNGQLVEWMPATTTDAPALAFAVYLRTSGSGSSILLPLAQTIIYADQAQILGEAVNDDEPSPGERNSFAFFEMNGVWTSGNTIYEEPGFSILLGSSRFSYDSADPAVGLLTQPSSGYLDGLLEARVRFAIGGGFNELLNSAVGQHAVVSEASVRNDFSFDLFGSFGEADLDSPLHLGEMSTFNDTATRFFTVKSWLLLVPSASTDWVANSTTASSSWVAETVVPEPGTASLMLLGLLGLSFVHRQPSPGERAR